MPLTCRTPLPSIAANGLNIVVVRGAAEKLSITIPAAFNTLTVWAEALELYATYVFFPVLAFISYLAGLLVMPLYNTLSRNMEREADRFALRRYPDLATFSSLMEKLSSQNLSNPSPAGWEEFLLYTHPSKRNRVAHAEKFVRMFLANSRQAV